MQQPTFRDSLCVKLGKSLLDFGFVAAPFSFENVSLDLSGTLEPVNRSTTSVVSTVDSAAGDPATPLAF